MLDPVESRVRRVKLFKQPSLALQAVSICLVTGQRKGPCAFALCEPHCEIFKSPWCFAMLETQVLLLLAYSLEVQFDEILHHQRKGSSLSGHLKTILFIVFSL